MERHVLSCKALYHGSGRLCGEEETTDWLATRLLLRSSNQALGSIIITGKEYTSRTHCPSAYKRPPCTVESAVVVQYLIHELLSQSQSAVGALHCLAGENTKQKPSNQQTRNLYTGTHTSLTHTHDTCVRHESRQQGGKQGMTA